MIISLQFVKVADTVFDYVIIILILTSFVRSFFPGAEFSLLLFAGSFV